MIDRRKYYSRDREKLDPRQYQFSSSRSGSSFGWGKKHPDQYYTTEDVRKALDKAFSTGDEEGLRGLSQHFYKISGLYSGAVNYLSNLPTYKYLLFPRIIGTDVDEEMVNREIIKQLMFLDTMNLKTTLTRLLKDTIKDGVAYRYLRRSGDMAVLQPLSPKWCRTTHYVNGFPTVEFNLGYFETFSGDERIRELNSFPPEIVRAFEMISKMQELSDEELKSMRIKRQDTSFEGRWILLDPKKATAFFFDRNLQPLLANSFFSILDLLEIKGVEKKKNENELFNLIVQTFKPDDNGELVFDFSEVEQFHKGAVEIFKNSDQTDVLTTFGDVQNINLNESTGQSYDFEPWKKDIYSELGISPQLFSTEGNMALNNSIKVDEATSFYIVSLFQEWMNHLLKLEFPETKERGFDTAIWFPDITTMNQDEKAKLYKDTASFGYSKFLSALAQGQDQLTMMSLGIYENNILELNNIMQPLKSSHTESGGDSGGGGGRPSLPDSEKSDKTIANQGG